MTIRRTSMMKSLLVAVLVSVASLALLRPFAVAAPGAKQPVFLVSTPNLSDPVFQKSVILMLPPTGIPLIVGLIINKPLAARVSDLFPDNPAIRNRPGHAFLGGPVDVDNPALVFRAEHGPVGALQVFGGVYVSLHEQAVLDTLKEPNSPKDLRLYLGRAQWAPAQLRNELMEGSWYILPADPATVFSHNPHQVWATLVEHARLLKAAAIADGMPPAPTLDADGLPQPMLAPALPYISPRTIDYRPAQ